VLSADNDAYLVNFLDEAISAAALAKDADAATPVYISQQALLLLLLLLLLFEVYK